MVTARVCQLEARRLAALVLAGFTMPCGAADLLQAPGNAPIPIDIAIRGSRQVGVPLGSNEPSLSSDGRLLAFVIRDSSQFAMGRSAKGVSKVHEASAVWVVDTSTLASERVTPTGVTSWVPTWSPDGTQLAFLSDQSGEVGLWIWSRERRESRPVPGIRDAASAFGLDYLHWTDSRHVLLKVNRQNGAAATDIDDLTSSEAASVQTGVRVYEWPPQAQERLKAKLGLSLPAVYRAAFSAEVVLVDVTTGLRRSLTTSEELPGGFALSLDGARLAVSLLRGRDEEYGRSDYEIIVVDLRGGHRVTVAPAVSELFQPPPMSWSLDGRYLAYSTHTSGYSNTAHGDCYVWSVREQRVTKVSFATGGRFGAVHRPPVWGLHQDLYSLSEGVVWEMAADASVAPRVLHLPGIRISHLVPITTLDGNRTKKNAPYFLVVGTKGSPDKTVTFGYSREHGWARLREDSFAYPSGGAHSGFAFASRAGGVAFLREAADEPPEFWYAPNVSTEARPITQLHQELKQYALGAPSLLTFVNGWGAPLYAALLLPPGFDAAKRYPTIVTAYPNETGGRHITQFGLGIRWGLDGQLLATRGYVVAYVDCPIRVERGSPMKDIAENMIPAVNQMIASGISDPNRIGAMGQSRGGYMVMALVVQTDLFSAAISVEPSTVSLPASAGELQHGTVIGGYGRTMWVEGDLWENTQGWIENSPFFYFPKVTTPVLIAAGGDSRAIVGDQIYAGLAQLGKRVSYARYFGEGHVPALWSSSNYRDFLERSVAWLDQFLKPMSVDFRRGGATAPRTDSIGRRSRRPWLP